MTSFVFLTQWNNIWNEEVKSNYKYLVILHAKKGKY